ncbi:uncharacterized protein LOC143892184 [Tasmannia lanceolata]|uniref:uncharacterized protein LOC143892184 n=1 Tax=Tasmannia lanceolata TaxID=3420 RepID=UPI00406448BD
MGNIMSQFQGPFVDSRQILDGVLIANEIIDSVKRSGDSGLIFKIDIEKAYDHIDWEVVDFIQERMGFGDKWRIWTKSLISNNSFSILINGSAEGFFKGSRGLR